MACEPLPDRLLRSLQDGLRELAEDDVTADAFCSDVEQLPSDAPVEMMGGGAIR